MREGGGGRAASHSYPSSQFMQWQHAWQHMCGTSSPYLLLKVLVTQVFWQNTVTDSQTEIFTPSPDPRSDSVILEGPGPRFVDGLSVHL